MNHAVSGMLLISYSEIDGTAKKFFQGFKPLFGELYSSYICRSSDTRYHVFSILYSFQFQYISLNALGMIVVINAGTITME